MPTMGRQRFTCLTMRIRSSSPSSIFPSLFKDSALMPWAPGYALPELLLKLQAEGILIMTDPEVFHKL